MIYVKLSVTGYKFIIRKTGSYLTSRDIKFHIEYSRAGIGLNYTVLNCIQAQMHTVNTRPNAIEVFHTCTGWYLETCGRLGLLHCVGRIFICHPICWIITIIVIR